jgi:hypothetical protein
MTNNQQSHNNNTTTNENDKTANTLGMPVLIQQNINQNEQQNQDLYWGCKLGQKREGTFRVALRNINSLPVN